MKLFIFAILLVSIIGIDALNKAKDCKCRINTQNRIVNGKLAPSGSYPWYASIELKLFEKLDLLIGATILSEDTLLTSGQYIPKSNNSTFVRKFLSKYKIVIKGSNETFGIKDFYPHPNIQFPDKSGPTNDIGIVKLDRKITFSRFVQPACLNIQKIDQYSGELNVAGFGYQTPLSYKNTSRSDPMIKFDFSEAKVFDRTSELCPNEKNQKICVHSDDKQGICAGDQGSGLHMIRNGKAFVIGVNGMPFEKKINENLSVYCSSGSSAVRLSAYKQFIDQYAGDYCN